MYIIIEKVNCLPPLYMLFAQFDSCSMIENGLSVNLLFGHNLSFDQEEKRKKLKNLSLCSCPEYLQRYL